MTRDPLAVVILAAGQGTRMKSQLPKVLHALANKPMLNHVIDAVGGLSPAKIVVVVGPDMDLVAKAAAPHATVVQEERLGTGHAVACARPLLEDFRGHGDVLVVYGDTPLLTPDTLDKMLSARYASEGGAAPDLVGLAFTPDDPARYGRVLCDSDGRIERIIEYADATSEERQIGLCNAGIILGRGAFLFDQIARLDNDNAKGEYYLTDVFALARAQGRPARAVEGAGEDVLGVNDRQELAAAEAVLQRRLRQKAMAGGVTLVDPQSVWLSADTVLAPDVVVQPNVFFGPGVRVDSGTEIRGFCHLEGVHIGPKGRIGPFARLRPGAVLGDSVHIGNFVEIKNAEMGQGAKANHLAYVGDAKVGSRANIGAGTITCNYDGFAKHRTEIGADAFIGSNTALVAPVSVGDGVIIGAGSTITHDVAPDSLALARGRQKSLPDRARQFRASQAKKSKA